jgi:type IV pilus assembly protein PilW
MNIMSVSLKRRRQGFSLVELMIAMTLGIIVMGAILYSYLGSRSSYRLNDEMSRLQENARVVMDRLGKDLQMAAYAGCAGVDRLRANAALTGAVADFRSGVFATHLNAGATLAGDNAYDLRVVAPSAQLLLTSDVSAGDNNINVNLAGAAINEAIAPGDLLILNNCNDGELLKIDAASSTSISVVDALAQGFAHADSSAVVISSRSGSPGVSYQMENAADGASVILKRNGQELVSGVEAFRVCFGTGNAYASDDSAIDAIVRAENVAATNLRNVISVHIDMVLGSDSPTLLEQNQTQIFTLCGSATPVTWTDKKLRKLFSTTVSLRNKQK